MEPTVDLASSQMVALPRASLGALRTALIRETGGAYGTFLQEAGFAGGESVYSAFGAWLAARGAGDPGSLDLPAFGAHASEFFRKSGWGSLVITPLHDVAVMVESGDWAESDATQQLPYPACHYSAGLLADFLGRAADSPLSVLEVECRSSGSGRCRFLVGSAEVMQHLYERMAAGDTYEAAAAGLA
jgi:predicted hydrocarbon binding protein